MLAAFLALSLGSAVGSPDREWECVRNRPCNIRLDAGNVTSDDLVLVLDEDRDSCPVCRRSSYGLCPWLSQDTGQDRTVMCEDGNFSSDWQCMADGHGDRLLCPVNMTMCAARLCGNGMDYCCESPHPHPELTCIHGGGRRTCPYVSMTEGLDLIMNETHGLMNPGIYTLCRCTEDNFKSGTTGELLGEAIVNGPSGSAMHQCISGHACPFVETNGYGLNLRTSLVQVTTVASCAHAIDTPAELRDNFRFAWQQDKARMHVRGEDTDEGRKWLAEQSPGVYKLCWCDNNTAGACESLSDFNVSAGLLSWRGPTKQDPRVVALGTNMDFQASGVWMTSASKVRIQKDCADPAGQVFYEATARKTIGAELFYNFGVLAEDRLPPGKYSLCWCEPAYDQTPPIECTDGTNFFTNITDIFVLCPAGQYSPNNGPCQSCTLFWQEPGLWRSACVTAAQNLAMVVAIVICYIMGWTAFWFQVGFLVDRSGRCIGVSGRKVYIEDISSTLSKTGVGAAIITTVSPHQLSDRFGTFPIYFYNTGHYLLDRRPAAGHLYRARRIGPHRLELLDSKGVPVESADTSRGYFVLRLARSMVHSDALPRLPVVLVVPFLVLIPPPLLVIASLEYTIPFNYSGGVATALLGIFFTFPLARIVKYFLRRLPPITDSVKHFRRKVREQNPQPKACPKGPDRALTIYQIFQLMSEFEMYIRDRNLYYIDSNIVQPLTRHEKLSLAELLGPSRVAWFVSHYWGTRFKYTCDALRRHAENAVSGKDGMSWQDVSYWICAFSNNQYQILEELGTSHQESSFYLALHSPSVQGTCMILDERALPLTRSWCLFELLQTMNLEEKRKDFQGLQFLTNTGVVNFGQATTEVAINIGKRLATLSLADADATQADDRDTIKSLVMKEMGSFDQIDKILRAHIKDALVVCKRFVEDGFNSLLVRLEETSVPISPENTCSQVS